MKNFIAATLLVLAPFVAFAGGHSALGGSGTGVRIDLKTIEGTSGTQNHEPTITTNQQLHYVY